MNIGTWLIGAGLLAGFLISAQGAINGRLAGHLGGPLHAALVSFSVGWLILAVIIIATRQGAPNWSGAAGAPWWVWIGGAMGAFMVSMSATAVP
ncbi:MAG: DMT family transporter, partial [Pseudomonadota bacterium]